MSPLRKEEPRYTYKDYITWDENFKCELIDGIPYVDGKPYDEIPPKAVMLAPAPAWQHQMVSGELFFRIRAFLEGKPCKVFSSPFDVRLNTDEGDDTVVQPDIVVICDSNKLSGTGCIGAPDMVIEVSSPSTTRRDKLDKFKMYQKAGVREYWIVEPDTKLTDVVIFKKEGYDMTRYSDKDIIPSYVLTGCEINMNDIFYDREF
ncbi:MAG: Uma2 family endonuclease [Oscillospiraceae bacterium]|nr:Uma2 family endonuclease [Oscillospiraceae bacterium]